MKKTFFLLSIFLLGTVSTFAATEQDQNAADFLATKNIIATSSDYKLDSTITRREMLKVMMNLSGKSIASTCSGKFKDLPSSDWGCKYAEAALVNGYISANTNFRPNDSVTNIEALKMVMQAKEMEIRYTEDYTGEKFTDWRDAYMQSAYFEKLLGTGGEFGKTQEAFTQNEYSKRGFVFLTASRSYEEFVKNTDSWRLFIHTDGWKVKYPENWSYRESDESFTQFGPHGNNGMDAFAINTSKESYESLLKPIELSEYFTVISTNIIDIQTSLGLTGKLYTTVVSSNGDEIKYTFKKAIIQGKSINYIFSGDENFMQGFYTTFQE